MLCVCAPENHLSHTLRSNFVYSIYRFLSISVSLNEVHVLSHKPNIPYEAEQLKFTHRSPNILIYPRQGQTGNGSVCEGVKNSSRYLCFQNLVIDFSYKSKFAPKLHL